MESKNPKKVMQIINRYAGGHKEGIAKMMRDEGFEILRCEQLKGFIYTVVGRKPCN